MDGHFSDISDLSSLSASPSPPPELYPSPRSSQDAYGTRNAVPASKEIRDAKERKTHHLDLSNSAKLSPDEQQSQINLLTKTLRRHRKIVVIAGAGISTSAGIPDFRSTDGLFKSLQKKHNLKASGKLLFDAAVYQDESLTASFHEMVRSLSEEAAKTSPTAFHHMLARLGQENRLMRLYTQNIDGIETSMPPLSTQVPLNNKAPWPRTIQLHGSLEKMVCQKCCHLADFQPELFDGPEPPLCNNCFDMDSVRAGLGQRSHGVGKMRPRIVLYNEHNPDEEAIASVMNADIRSRPDALVVVGTSLKIPGVRRLVKSLCKVIRARKNGIAMWVNSEPPVGKEFEDCWDLVVKGDCEEVARLVGLKHWDDNSAESLDECDFSGMEGAKGSQRIFSVAAPPVSKPNKKRKIENGLLTPSSQEESSELRRNLTSTAIRKNEPKIVLSLTDVLKRSKAKETQRPARKQSTSKSQPKKMPGPTKNSKITTFTKVTKSSSAASGFGKKAKTEKADFGQAMSPLPLVDARYNGPASTKLPEENTLSKRKRERKGETISPPSKPNGFTDLIT